MTTPTPDDGGRAGLESSPFAVRLDRPDSTPEFRFFPTPGDAFRELLRLLHDGPAATRGAWGLRAEYPDAVLVPMRILPGAATERARVAHMLRMQPGEWHGCTLIAPCGTRMDVRTAEFLGAFRGMPCERCFLAQATAQTPQRPGKVHA